MVTVRPNLHFAWVCGTPIFLDLSAGRYFLLSGNAAAHFTAFAAVQAMAADIKSLLQLNILVDGPGIPESRQDIPSARSSYIDAAIAPASMTMLARAIALQTVHSFLLARRGLSKTLDVAKAAQTRPGFPYRSSTKIDEAVVASAFFHAQRIFPSANKCLPRSFAIADLLRRTGHRPTIVIGVQLPFAAHCWVQCEDRLVSDPLERVGTFVPILAA